MKLLLLLSDEAQIAHRRDAELKVVQEERDDVKAKVAVLLNKLLKNPKSQSGIHSDLNIQNEGSSTQMVSAPSLRHPILSQLVISTLIRSFSVW